MKFHKKIEAGQIWILLLAATACSFPFGKNLTSLLLISFVVFSIIYFFIKRKTHPVSLDFKLGYVTWLLALPILYYGWSLVGMLNTENKLQGLTELSKRISFLFLPAIFLIFRNEFDRAKINLILKAYVIGLIASACISLFLGFYYSFRIVDGDLIFRTAVNETSYQRGDSFFLQPVQGGNYFFGDYITPFIENIIYYAINLSLGIAVVLLATFYPKRRWLYWLIASVFFVVLFFCDSRGPLISFFLTIFIVINLLVYKRRWSWLIFPLLIAGIFIGIRTGPRTSLLLENLNSIRSSISYQSTESTALRIIVWKSAIEIIKDNLLFGVGTGDARDSMQKQTKAINQMAYEQRLNAHNQYLETLVTGGIVAFFLLMSHLLLAFLYGLKTNSHLLIAFILLMSFNMLFESTLQVFQGIQLFIFFYCVLIILSYRLHEDTIVV